MNGLAGDSRREDGHIPEVAERPRLALLRLELRNRVRHRLAPYPDAFTRVCPRDP